MIISPSVSIFLEGRLTRLSEVKSWATTARYTPGQVWCPRHVPRTDVNPRLLSPLNPLVPSRRLHLRLHHPPLVAPRGLGTRDREAGAYYDRSWSAALALSPELVGITSFNEWHEGTQIEPAVPKQITDFTYLDYQPLPPDYYLNRTAHWGREWQNR